MWWHRRYRIRISGSLFLLGWGLWSCSGVKNSKISNKDSLWEGRKRPNCSWNSKIAAKCCNENGIGFALILLVSQSINYLIINIKTMLSELILYLVANLVILTVNITPSRLLLLFILAIVVLHGYKYIFRHNKIDKLTYKVKKSPSLNSSRFHL